MAGEGGGGGGDRPLPRDPTPAPRPERVERPASRGDEINAGRELERKRAEELADALRPKPPVPIPDERLIKRHQRRLELLQARRRASRANVQLSQRQSVGPSRSSTLG